MVTSEETLLNRELPKWPLMLVTGTPIREDQALEIIRRTDQWFVLGRGCNDPEGDRRLAQRFRMPHYRRFDDPPPEDRDAYEIYRACWKKKWGTINTRYVHNDWIGSCFAAGPHGWCRPDGQLYYYDGVGSKWPSVEGIRADWQTLATAFPFLTLTATLVLNEATEASSQAVVAMHITNGKTTLLDPSLVDYKGCLEARAAAWAARSKAYFAETCTAKRARYPFSEDVLCAWEKKALEVDEELRTYG